MFVTDKKELEKFSEPHRLWQGIPSIERTRKGRLFFQFNWTETIDEKVDTHAVILKTDDGKRFDIIAAVYVKDEDKPCRTCDGCLWIDPLGRLWCSWNYMDEDENLLYAVICEDPDGEELVWGEPFVIGTGVMLNKPTVLSTGEWLFPVAVWIPQAFTDTASDFIHSIEPGSYVYRSTDQGRSFEVLGKCGDFYGKDCDEHMLLERKDGILAMYIRSLHGIGISYSYDRGKTWSLPNKRAITGPGSRFHVRRLKSGRVLLINHVDFKWRNNLTALLSEDDGRTWKYRLLLDGRDNVSYPDAVEGEDGYIHIVYDRERGSFQGAMKDVYRQAREILYARITEEDIMAGELVNEGSRLKCVVSKLGEYVDGNPFVPGLSYSAGEFARKAMKVAPQDEIGKIFEAFPQPMGMPLEWCHQLDRLVEKERKAAAGGERKCAIVEIVEWLRTAPLDCSHEREIVDRVIGAVMERLEENPSLGELADGLGLGAYYMQYVFQKRTGISVESYMEMYKGVRMD